MKATCSVLKEERAKQNAKKINGGYSLAFLWAKDKGKTSPLILPLYCQRKIKSSGENLIIFVIFKQKNKILD